jgi:Trypsin-like peptidase domain
MQKTKWPELSWDKVCDKVEKITYRIYAGDSAGTCFVVSAANYEDDYYTMFATAWHVIEHTIGNDLSLRFVSFDRKTIIGDDKGQCGIFRLGTEIFDTALIMVKTKEPIIDQKDLLPMLSYEYMMPRGSEIGVLGFPGLVEPELCFFKGCVSGYLNEPPTYLIDGVAINGVSGGPAFDNRAHLIGLVSAYIPNRVNQFTTLPGLMSLMPIAAIRYYLENQMKASII